MRIKVTFFYIIFGDKNRDLIYRQNYILLQVVFANRVIGHRINPSWLTPRAVCHSSQCFTTGVTKRPWYVLFCLKVIK